LIASFMGVATEKVGIQGLAAWMPETLPDIQRHVYFQISTKSKQSRSFPNSRYASWY